MDAKIPVNNLLSTCGRQVGFFIAWVTAVWSGRGTGNTRETSFPFPSRTESPPPPPHHASFFSNACHRRAFSRTNDKQDFVSIINAHLRLQWSRSVKRNEELKKKKNILLAKLRENWRYKCFAFVVNAHDQILTSLKKSPTHLAIIRTSIIGMPKLMFPVASIKITVRLIVIRTTPPARKARKEQKTVRQLTTKHASWSVVNRGEAVFRKAQARKVLCMPYGKKCGTTAAIHYKCIFLHWFGKRFRLATVLTTLWSNTQRGVYS